MSIKPFHFERKNLLQEHAKYLSVLLLNCVDTSTWLLNCYNFAQKVFKTPQKQKILIWVHSKTFFNHETAIHFQKAYSIPSLFAVQCVHFSIKRNSTRISKKSKNNTNFGKTFGFLFFFQSFCYLVLPGKLQSNRARYRAWWNKRSVLNRLTNETFH